MKNIHTKILGGVLCALLVLGLFGPTLPTNAATKKPATVSSLKESDATATSVSLTWKKAKNASGYEVWTSTSKKDSGFKKEKTISKASTVSYTMKKASGKKLAANKTYYVKVRAYSGKGKSKQYGKYSSVLKVYTAPGNISSLSCTEYDSTSFTIEWKKVSGATGYYVEVYDSDDGEVDDSITKDLEESFSDLTEGETYTVKVYAYKQVKPNGKKINIYGATKTLKIALPEEDPDFDTNDDTDDDTE